MSLASRFDGFVNALSGLGVALGKGGQTQVAAPVWLSDVDLASLYDSTWLAARIVDMLPGQALQSGFSVPDEVQKAFDAVNYSEEFPQGALFRALCDGRLFGGAAILIGALSSEALDGPLPENATIAWLDVVPRRYLKCREKDEDPSSATYGRAKLWEIIGKHRRVGLVVHASRLILCEGIPIASEISGSKSWDGAPLWGSVLQPVNQTLAQYEIAWSAVGELIQESSIGVMRMAGVIRMLGSESKSAIDARLALLSQSRSVAKTILLDSEHGEEFTRTAVSFADLPALMVQIAQRASGAAGVPATLLFGMSPAGMNATGESDLRQFYDRAAQYQKQSVTPKLARILSLLGYREEIKWPSIWTPSEAETAQARNANASADRTWFDIGALDSEDIRASRKADGSFGVTVLETRPERSEPSDVSPIPPEDDQETTTPANPSGEPATTPDA